MARKFTLEEVRKKFKSEGYTLLSTEYTGNRQKLDVVCPKGHNLKINFMSFQHGSRCRFCRIGTVGENTRKSLEFIRKEFEKEGYTLLSTEYKNGSTSKLEYICPRGHKGFITWSAWKTKGQRCKKCFIENSKERFENRARKYIESFGYKLNSQYISANENIELICPEGHKWTTTFARFKNGTRCRFCNIDKLRLKIEDVRESFENEEYILLSDTYHNSLQKLDCICDKGHKYSISYSNWKAGWRCPYCSCHISDAEKELFEHIRSIFPNTKNNNREEIKPLELDIFIPEKKLAVEYCGLYWHSELKGKSTNYHLNKLNKCNEKNLRLLTVFEDEYIYKKDITLSFLYNILGMNEKEKVYARDCNIVELDPFRKNLFLERNHLQSADTSLVKLGAVHEDKLVSVMTFSQGSISKGNKSKKGIYELSRFCSRKDLNVIGIASKLFKYFIKNYKPREVFSYSDRRWSEGNLYKVLGFEFSHHTKPNYWYIVGDRRIHRFNFRKSELPKKLETFDPNLSEWENMKANGYNRIWDCGNTKWIWRNE